VALLFKGNLRRHVEEGKHKKRFRKLLGASSPGCRHLTLTKLGKKNFYFLLEITHLGVILCEKSIARSPAT
jgi:hypothetical protein